MEYFYLVESVDFSQLAESQNYFQLMESQNYFRLKIIHSFKLRIFNIDAVRFWLAYYFHHNFFNTMYLRKTVVAIHQTFSYGSRGKDEVEFIQCVGWQEPQTHELWTFSEDGITCKVHTFVRVVDQEET